ncbi:MAG: mycothiol synthase [Acidimicrobiales bacterium]
MELTVEGPNPGEFRWTIGVDESDGSLQERLAAALDDREAGDGVQLWIRPVDDRAHAVATDLGFVAYRDLWQLRCDLPARPSGLPTRAFDPDNGHDLDDFVRVNNRAFHWHPEQGGLTAEAALATMQEPWFDPDGFRLYHARGSDGADELAGFCWTKVHSDHDPPLGEIYVIAVDPGHHGQGLGKPMTLAGLEWLADRGLRHGMLYVESDNDPANATYAALGFTRHHTDRAYRLDR